MNRRAMRKHRLQNPAWALVAALLPATGGWASEGPDASAIKPGPASATVSSVPSDPGNTDSDLSTPKIPMPRRFSTDAIQAPNSFPASRGPRSPHRDGLQPRRPSRSSPLNRRPLKPPSRRSEPQPVGSMEAQELPLNTPLADSNIEPAEARSLSAETAGLRRSVESQSANPERESVTPTATPAPVQAMPASVAEPAAASQVAEPAPQGLTAQPARMPEVARPEAKSSNATKDQSVTTTSPALMDLLPQQAEEPPVAEPRTIQVTTAPTAATEASRRSEDVVNNLNAELAPVQSPSKASAQAARPASMPEAVNQALKVLAAPPVLSLESTPTSASSPVPAPEGNREPSPNQGATSNQNAVSTNVKPEAVAKSDSEPSPASPPTNSQARLVDAPKT